MSMEIAKQAAPSVQNTSVAAPIRIEAAPVAAPAPQPAEAVEVPAPQVNPVEVAKQIKEEAAVERKRMELAERLVGANKSLVIEKDPVKSGFIYKTIDRQTGEVTRVWPQEEAETALRAMNDFDARGAMINTRV